jgi:hypothetical protein
MTTKYRVVNVSRMKKADRAGVVYCARAVPRAGWPHSHPLANPVPVPRDATDWVRDTNLWDYFYHHIAKLPDLRAQLERLRVETGYGAKPLGCWCKPKACHCDILAAALEYDLADTVLDASDVSRLNQILYPVDGVRAVVGDAGKLCYKLVGEVQRRQREVDRLVQENTRLRDGLLAFATEHRIIGHVNHTHS